MNVQNKVKDQYVVTGPFVQKSSLKTRTEVILIIITKIGILTLTKETSMVNGLTP